jgi:Ribonucleases G and E
MPKEILINAEPQERRVAIVADGKLDEFYIERPQDKTIVGNIYKGRIDAVLPSIGGAFVDIGLPKKGFLYLSEIEYSFDVLESDNPPAAEQQQPQQHNKRRGGRHNKHRSAKSASTLLGSIKKKGRRSSCRW